MNHLKNKENQPKKSDLNSKKSDEEIIDETLKETFPASDAPSWYGGKDIKNRYNPDFTP
ncbi:Uncharacterised protein [Legionella busanensis]|uniref:Uncharacterized protein n=1 Tax=Legionella busanensis TaxID=190655 RepID=A0A378JN27_9GAMM|nr:hypothetical protein [Legionella busanensis]STX51410.1 Uncharacterised protein [Legionella busanensis]